MRDLKIRKELRENLFHLFKQGYGREKHDIKDEHNATPFIHSKATYQTYRNEIERFANYLRDDLGITKSKQIPNKEILKSYACGYIEKLKDEGKSAWTINTALCGIAKAMYLKTTDFNVVLPKRERAAVTRSRYETETDKHISKAQNEAVINFLKCSGLRRREVEKLSTSDFYMKNDLPFIHVSNGKGGKPREVRLFGTDIELKKIEKLIADKEGKVFGKIPKNLDIHSYRAIYASRAYLNFARPIDAIPLKERYVCRRDKAGIVYDRHAMQLASFLLGHNRVDVIATSYLHTLSK